MNKFELKYVGTWNKNPLGALLKNKNFKYRKN